MEIRQLKSFKTVANLLSFNKAAGQLNYAQSSISVQIHSLEEELGVQLFDRLGKRVQLTESGTQLLQYADKIMDLLDETHSAVSGDKELRGSLTVRIPETFGVHRLPAVLRAFHSAFPNVQLSFITCALEGLAKDLRKGVTDLAFLLAESISAPDLDVETIGFESVVLVAGPDHPLNAKRSVHTRDLTGETILFSRVDCSYRKIFEQILAQEEVARFNRLDFNSVEVLKQCVMAGLGGRGSPRNCGCRRCRSKKRLVVLPWSESRIEVAILMIWFRDRWISPTLQAFMDMTRKVIKQT